MYEIENSANGVTIMDLQTVSFSAKHYFEIDSKFNKDLTQAERRKRHTILRCLIAQLRREEFALISNSSRLVFDHPKLDASRNFGSLDSDELFKLGVCWIPNFILNSSVCEKLAKCFGDLSVCGCFLQIGEVWRLDIDEHLSRKGLFLPVRSPRDGFIYGLKVFRHPDDQKPFLLKIRGVGKYD